MLYLISCIDDAFNFDKEKQVRQIIQMLNQNKNIHVTMYIKSDIKCTKTYYTIHKW